MVSRDEPVVISIKGHLFGLASCSEKQYLNDPGIIDNVINKLKEQKCERIIMLFSWGDEKDEHHSIVQEAMARRSVLAGADLIIGSHPETLQGIEKMFNVPVIYSLGNLLDGSSSRKPKVQQGILIRAVFHFENGLKNPDIMVIPINPFGEQKNYNDFCPSAELNASESRETVNVIRNDSYGYSIENIHFYFHE